MRYTQRGPVPRADREIRISERRLGHDRRAIAKYAAAGLVILAGAMLLSAASCGKSKTGGNAPVYTVKRGPLAITVVESGTIRPRQREVIKSELEGQASILYLVPEGTLVTKGQLLVELDSSRLQDTLVEEQIKLRNSEAAFTRATESLAVAQNQAAADVAKATLDAQFAKEDLKNYLEGQYPKDLKEAESKITLAHEEMKRTAEKYKWSEMLFKEKYLSQTELESDRLAMQRAELEHDLAISSHDLLKNFSFKRKVDELKSNVDQTSMALERATRKARADTVQAESDLSAKESEFARQKGKVDKLGTQITKAKMFAPREGMVVYASSAQSGRYGSSEPLAEGQSVRERQELIYLPTASAFNVDVRIHEASLDKVRIGLPVRVTVDALPGKVFNGRVVRIAPMPDAQSHWANPDLKVYATDITLDEEDPAIKTGMTCRAEIMVDYFEDAVFVPVQSVLRVNGMPTVFLPKGEQSEARPVEIGMDNNQMVHVISGLQENEIVMLTPPLTSGAAPLAGQDGSGAKIPPKPATRAAVALNADAATQPTELPTSRPAGRKGGKSPKDMTPDELEAWRKRMESMTPEERERMKQQYMKKGGDGGARPNPEGANP